MSQYEFQRPPIPVNFLAEVQKMHAQSIALQTSITERLDQLVAAQKEQNDLVRQLVQALSQRP